MSSKYKKMKTTLSSFVILALIFVHTSCTTAQQVIDLDQLDKPDLTNIEISLSQAQTLCQQVHDSRIQIGHMYMWTQVKSIEPSKPEQGIFKPGCFTIKYVACKGETQYPISDSCGFFTLVPEKECSSSSSTRRSRRAISSQKITLSHGEAIHLCASVQNLPEDTPFQIQYVPIRIKLAAQDHVADLSDDCLMWTYEPCAQNDQQSTECKTWSIKISSVSKCAIYSNFFSTFNSSQIARYPNPMRHKTDFIVGGNSEEEPVIGVKNLLAESMQCTRDGETVSCEIVKKGKGDRSKREASSPQIPVSRVKRACCGLHRCGPCGRPRFGAIGLRAYPPNQGEVDGDCDCSFTDPDTCNCCGACDMNMFPSGCYGNCLCCG